MSTPKSFKPFPAVAFQSRLFSLYLRLVGPTTEAPDSAIFGALLSGLAVLVGRIGLPWGGGMIVPVVNVAILGNTAKARKSTTVDDVADLVVRPLMPKSTLPGEPPPMEIVTGSGSGEGFAEAIADREWGKGGKNIQTGRRALFVIHEFAGVLEKIKRDQAGNMLDFILNLFDARASWSHRTRNDALTISNAVGALLVATTYEWLVKNLSETAIMAGLANRFLWLDGERKAPLFMRPAIPAADIAAFQTEVRDALAAVAGATFQLTQDAADYQKLRYTAEFSASTESNLLDAATARIDQLALRVAMLFAVGDSTPLVERHHIEAAWAVCDYSREVVVGLLERIEATTIRENEQRVLKHARVVGEKKEWFSKSNVRDRVKGPSGMPAAIFNSVWNSLIIAGDLVMHADGIHVRVNS